MGAIERKYPGSLNKIITVFIIFLFFSCANSDIKQETKSNLSKTKDDQLQEKSVLSDSTKDQHSFVPDTTINKKLRLLDYLSLENFYHGKITLINTIRQTPVVSFCTKDKKQYLLAYQYEGDTKNAFSVFEVGHISSANRADICNLTNEKSFSTESGLTLGISLNELITIKGQNYILSKQDSVLKYRIDSALEFLDRYKMPGYFLECQIKNGKVSNIKFGFDYP